MPFYRKEIRSGRLLEVSLYFATRDGKKVQRGPNLDDTPEDMEKVNQRNSEKQLMRLIHCNFDRTAGDQVLLFDHAKNLTEQEAMREERNLLDRLKRARERKGLPPAKWISITEKQSKWHHHLIINGGLTLEELAAVWGDRGEVSARMLQQTYTYEELAKYLTRGHKPPKGKPEADSIKPKRQKGRRRWHASRNLNTPDISKKPIKRMPRPGEPKAPKGYQLLPDWFCGCDMLGNYYTYFSCVKEGEAATAPKVRAGAIGGVRGRSPGGAGGSAPMKQKRKGRAG